jgi:pimeloyl-ACP methyl ester carboxylesterase
MKRILAAGAGLTLILPMLALGKGPHLQTFVSNGVHIQYTVEGQGEPVVLIHGLGANAQINWRVPGIIKELTNNFQVIALDVRGHGGSDKPQQADAYGVEMVEDIVRLLDHLKIEKARMVGYSMGGMITMKLLTRHPERVSSAVLGGMGWLREGSALEEFWGRMPDRPKLKVPPACMHSLGGLAVTEGEVKAIHVPVIIVVGERDPVRQLYVTPLQRIRPDWPVMLVPDAGHINCIFKGQFREDIRDSLDLQKDQQK